MRKTKAEAQKTRQQLLRAALDTFYLRGVGRASLHEIAQAAGVTRGALYWHFKNKEDLFDGLFGSIFEELSAKLAHDIETRAPNIWESFEMATIAMFQRLETDEVFRKFFNTLHTKCDYTEQNHAIVKIMRRYQDMWQRQLTETLMLSLEQKQLPDNIDMRMAVLYMMTVIGGLMDVWLNMPEQFSISDIAPRIIRSAMYSLQHAPDLCQLPKPVARIC